MRLRGKVAIVTGGSRGIGREVVKTLAMEQATVAFTYRERESQAYDLVREMANEGHDVECFAVDVRDDSAIAAFVRGVHQRHHRIDILVNNAGIVRDALLMQMDGREFDEVIETNLVGVFKVTRQVLPFMIVQRGGKIINISSVAATSPGSGHTNYAASKGGINSFTKALAVEVAKRNINVNAIAPGLIETEMSREVRERYGAELLRQIPLGRFGKPADVAKVVLFLASPDSDYIAGEIIQVSGGYKM